MIRSSWWKPSPVTLSLVLFLSFRERPKTTTRKAGVRSMPLKVRCRRSKKDLETPGDARSYHGWSGYYVDFGIRSARKIPFKSKELGESGSEVGCMLTPIIYQLADGRDTRKASNVGLCDSELECEELALRSHAQRIKGGV